MPDKKERKMVANVVVINGKEIDIDEAAKALKLPKETWNKGNREAFEKFAEGAK